MTETYSLGLTGLRAGYFSGTKVVQIGDTAGRNAVQCAPPNIDGGPSYAMAQNTQILCKNPDGSQSWYTFDAERSTPGNLVMKAV